MSTIDVEEKSLTSDENSRSPGKPVQTNPWDPSQFPDGGLAAWVVVAGAFCNVLCSFGWINCEIIADIYV